MVFKKIAIFWQFPARSGVFSAFVMLGLAWQRCPFAVRYIQTIWEQILQSASRGEGGKTSERALGRVP